MRARCVEEGPLIPVGFQEKVSAKVDMKRQNDAGKHLRVFPVVSRLKSSNEVIVAGLRGKGRAHGISCTRRVVGRVAIDLVCESALLRQHLLLPWMVHGCLRPGHALLHSVQTLSGGTG